MFRCRSLWIISQLLPLGSKVSKAFARASFELGSCKSKPLPIWGFAMGVQCNFGALKELGTYTVGIEIYHVPTPGFHSSPALSAPADSCSLEMLSQLYLDANTCLGTGSPSGQLAVPYSVLRYGRNLPTA